MRYDEDGSEEYGVRGTRWQRMGRILNWRDWNDRAERSYLLALRYFALVFATIAAVAALILFGWGAAMQIGSADATPEPLTIAGTDLASAIASSDNENDDPVADAVEKAKSWRTDLPQKFRNSYFAIYEKQFKPFERAGEKSVTNAEFFQDAFPAEIFDEIDDISNYNIDAVNIDENVTQQIGTSDPVLTTLFVSIRDAASDARVKKELGAYRSAKKAQVCRNVTENRTRTVEGWDRFSTSCSDWYEYPYGCSGTRSVSEPVTTRVCAMQFPENIAAPRQILKELQANYFVRMRAKRTEAVEAAELANFETMTRKARGLDAISNSAWAFLAFLTIMFLYLMIAMERHHRLIATRESNRPPIE